MRALVPATAFSFLILTVSALHSQNADQMLKELMPPRTVVADADNGWVEARNLTANHPLDAKGRKMDFIIYPGDDGDNDVPGVKEEVLKECLELNKATLATARKILLMPAWQRPRPAGRWPASLLETYDQRIVFPVRVMMAEAIVEAQKGHLDKAWPDIMAVMKLGRRIAESGGTLMDTLVGLTLVQKAAQTAAWAGQQAPDAAMARRLAADLEAFEGYGDIYQRTLEGELYWVVKQAELYQAGGEEVKRSLVEWYVAMDSLRHIQEHLNEWGRSLKGRTFKAGESFPEYRPGPDYPREENLAKWLKDPPQDVLRQIEEAKQTDWAEHSRLAVEQFSKARLIKPTSLADFLKAQRPDRDTQKQGEEAETTDFDATRKVQLIVIFRGAASVRQARTSLLLRAWMYEHDGELPKTLDALVPGYMPALPVDPFDGRTMRYRKDKLWSVGGDLKDGEGDKRNDIVLPL